MPFNTKPNDGRKFWMSFVVVTVVILYLGFYLVSTIINTETYLFDNAFAQQQALSNITNSDNSFMIANNNTLSSGNGISFFMTSVLFSRGIFKTAISAKGSTPTTVALYPVPSVKVTSNSLLTESPATC